MRKKKSNYVTKSKFGEKSQNYEIKSGNLAIKSHNYETFK